MADLNIAEIFTKIILRNDVAEAWATSTLVLEMGEPALEIDLEKGVAKFKIGDGTHNFNELPYSTSTPDEIQAMIDAAIQKAGGFTGGGEGTGIQSVTLSSGTENGTLKITVDNTTIDNIAVTGLGSAAFTDVSDYATAEQGVRADRSMNIKGTIGSSNATVETLPLDASIGDTYKVVANFTIGSDVSYTGIDVKVVSGDLIIAMDNNKWFVLSCGAIEQAKSLTEGISAELTGAISGKAIAPANAGETMKIEVTSINFDYISTSMGGGESGDGEVTELVINGGGATPIKE